MRKLSLFRKSYDHRRLATRIVYSRNVWGTRFGMVLSVTDEGVLTIPIATRELWRAVCYHLPMCRFKALSRKRWPERFGVSHA